MIFLAFIIIAFLLAPEFISMWMLYATLIVLALAFIGQCSLTPRAELLAHFRQNWVGYLIWLALLGPIGWSVVRFVWRI